MMREHIRPTNVVHNAVLIPNAISDNAFCRVIAFDTSTLSGPYANVPNPTLKTINGVEVYEFVGTYETGYNIIGVTDSTTPEPILITFRYE